MAALLVGLLVREEQNQRNVCFQAICCVASAGMHFSSGLDKASRSIFYHKGLRRSHVSPTHTKQLDCLGAGLEHNEWSLSRNA